MHFGAEELMRHRATDQRRSDVVEKTGKNPYHHQQQETAFPIMRKILRQNQRHMAFLEMARQQSETHEQAKKVRKDDPLVADVRYKSNHAGTGLEAGESDFIDRDRHQAGERHTHGMMMEHRYTEQGQTE